MTALALTIAVQGQTETVDTAQFVAMYDYECRTLNDEDVPITDRMQIVLQVGRTMTKCMPRSQYRVEDEEVDIATSFQEAYMHMPTVWTGWPTGKTTIRDFIYPHEFEGYESTPDIAWTLLDDTVTINGYHCQQATATLRGVEWRVCYTEEIPSSAGVAPAWPARTDCTGRERGTHILHCRVEAGAGAHHRTNAEPRGATDEIPQAAEVPQRGLRQPPVYQKPYLLYPRPQ